MLYDLSNPYDLEKFIEAVRKARERKCRVELKQVRHRTLRQNNYLHLIVAYFAVRYGIGTDDAKQTYFKRLVNKDLFVRDTVLPDGTTRYVTRSTAELSTEEMTLAISRFRNWAAAGGIYLPEPFEEQAIFAAQKEIEQARQYDY